MYNDTIKAENKIISSDDLAQIFQLMGETLKKYQRIYALEEQRNRSLDYFDKRYSFKDEGSKMKVTVDFYDDTTITFDKYENFIAIFYSRLAEIKSLDVYYHLSYEMFSPENPSQRGKIYNHTINMYITENKMDINVKLNSEDAKLEDIYNLIKNKILNAPEKYDDIVKNRNKITNVVILGTGIIPALIISTILLFVPGLNILLLRGYIFYPLCNLLFAYVIGSMIASSKLDKFYNTIIPEKVVSYKNGVRKEDDDLNKYLGTSEILIGKKINNQENRRRIKVEYDKYKELLPKELIALLGISLVVIIIGLFL